MNWPFALAVAALAALLVLLPGSAWAQELPRLQGPVTDLTRARVLAGEQARIEAALGDLLDEHNVQLWVLFVESTGSRSVTEFADQVAALNSLGGNDALLVVALSDRTDALWRGSASLERLTDRELEDVLTRRVEPLLARGDFPGAVVEGASGVGAAAGEAAAGPGPPLGGVPGALLLVPVLGVGGVWLWRRVAAGRKQGAAARERTRQLEKLAREANSQLIKADEAVRDAQEEIAFAEAQFSEAELAPFRQALATASEELKAAFTLREQLADEVPEDDETRRRMHEEIVQRAQRAQSLLEEQRQEIARMRDLERNAPDILTALPAELEAIEARLPTGESTLVGFERFSERSWGSVRGNLDAARERLARARSAVAAGRGALDRTDRSAAGRSVRAAQQAASEASQLLAAIDSMARSLNEAEAESRPRLEAAAADVRAARAALAGGAVTELAARLGEAERSLAQADRELAADKPDFLLVVRLATEADTLADQILAEVKAGAERRERETRILAAALRAAEVSHAQAADYLAARRRRIGWRARTRLAEAERHLERARLLAADDPATALAEAQQARQLAESAYALAREDVDTEWPYGGWGGRQGGVAFPIPFPIPTGGWGGGSGGGSGWGGGWSGGGGGGGAVGGRW